MNTSLLRLSSVFTKGTCEQRAQRADYFNSLLFSRMYELYKGTDRVELGAVKKTFKDFLPESFPFGVREYPQDDRCKAVLSTYFDNGKPYYCEMGLGLKNDKLEVETLSEMIHESTHLWDYLLNPKILRNNEKLRKKGLLDSVEEHFIDVYYKRKTSYDKENAMKNAKKSTNKFLSKFAPEDKLLALNYIRYSLMMESHAFREGKKAANTLKAYNRNYLRHDVTHSDYDFMLKEKLELVNDMTSELIEKERYKNAQRLAKTPKEKINNFIGYYFKKQA